MTLPKICIEHRMPFVVLDVVQPSSHEAPGKIMYVQGATEFSTLWNNVRIRRNTFFSGGRYMRSIP